MTQLYNLRYSQAIPGINRSDDSIQFMRGEKCISHFGDGLTSCCEKLSADAALSQKQGRDTRVWCEALKAAGDGHVRDALRLREKKLAQWKDHLNGEVDRLAKELENVNDCRAKLVKKRQYFSNLFGVSGASSEFRKRMEDLDPNDPISTLLKEEKDKISKADKDAQKSLDDLKECERKLQRARKALMSEAEAKSLTINIGRRCQHSEALLNLPYVPQDHPVDQIYHPNTEEDWERSLADKYEAAVQERQEAVRTCNDALTEVRRNCTDVAEAWLRTSKALQEAVQEEEKTGHNIRTILRKINQDVACTHQRIASLYNDLRIQNKSKDHQLWRLQTMTFRPGQDHIRDEPIRRLDEEVGFVEKRIRYVTENVEHNEELLRRLLEEKASQTLELERFSRRLFVEKENCLGIRRTVRLEGVNLCDYI